MSTFWMLVLGVVLLVPGCAYTPQAVKLRPEIQIADSSLGKGRPVQVSAVDERPRSTLGVRGVRGIGAELTVEGDLVSIIGSSLSDGLKRQGFVPQATPATDRRELRVEIRNLDYTLTQGFASGTLRTECSLKAICMREGTRPYERLYRGEMQDTVMAVQSEEENNRYMNEAVSRALNALFQDQQLSTCLAE